MGSGIAQLGCAAGMQTLLHDPDADALKRGIERIERQLDREVSAERLAEADAPGPRSTCAPRRRSRLRRLRARDRGRARAAGDQAQPVRPASEVVSADCVLATNTSSLLVTALAPAASHPERVVGMHFFNPPPLMALLEVVAGIESSERALAVARAAGEAMGKRVIDAVDGPGFLVNRCNRPWGLEALKLLSEGIATVEQIDRICRLGGGFRMGPFELMDLVGVDVGLDISRSFYEQSFGEPRWQPSPITVKTVAAGRNGRKSGRGYYEYPESAPTASPIPTRPPPAGATA